MYDYEEQEGLVNYTGDGHRWRSIPLEDRARFAWQLETLVHTPEKLKEFGYDLGEPTTTTPDYRDIVPATRKPPVTKRKAIVVDCETVGVREPWDAYEVSALAQLVVVDFLTGDVLANVLVWPCGFWDYRTPYCGISKRTYRSARLGNDLVFSTAKARLRLFEHIDRNTVIVGHALHNDFKALEMRHHRESLTRRSWQRMRRTALCGRTGRLVEFPNCGT